MCAAQGGKGLRQQVRDGAGGGAQPDAAFQAQHLALDVVERLFGIGEQATRAAHQGLADAGRADLPAAAQQQRGADPLFQFSDMQAHRRRRQVQGLRGRGKGAEVGDGDQRAQAVEAQFAHGA